MNYKKSITVGLLLALVQGQDQQFNYDDILSNIPEDYEFDFSRSSRDFLERIDYDPDLNCGDCVAGGHNFCWRARVPGEILTDDDYPVFNSMKKSKGKDNTDTEARCCYNSEDVSQEYRNLYCENIVWANPAN